MSSTRCSRCFRELKAAADIHFTIEDREGSSWPVMICKQCATAKPAT